MALFIMAFTQYNVNTVLGNAKDYTPKQLLAARRVRHLQYTITHPPDTDISYIAHPPGADVSAIVRCNMLKRALYLPLM